MNIEDMQMIGSGAEADVYIFQNKAIKVFKHGRSLANVRFEAELQRRAYQSNLPVPAIYDVFEIEGRAAIRMEYAQGKTVGELMLLDDASIPSYMHKAVALQMQVHEVRADGFPSQREKLKENIEANTYLNADKKQDLLHRLQEMETDNMLCHGDFHVLNLVSTSKGVKIIDWVCSSSGSILADVCRTYLLYTLYHPEFAEPYLDIYCEKSSIPKAKILAWLPILAGARLHENVTPEHVTLLLGLA